MVDIVYEDVNSVGIVRKFTINGKDAQVGNFGEVEMLHSCTEDGGVKFSRKFSPFCQTKNILAAYSLTSEEYDEICLYLKQRIEL